MTISDELTISSSLDQPISVNMDNRDKLFELVDGYVKEAKSQNNPYIALNACKDLLEVSQLAGLALAKMFYDLKQMWEEFDVAEEFEDIAYIYLGKHPHTINRYLRVWSMFAENKIPNEQKDAMMGMNIKSLIPVANALEQGHEIDEDEWEEIAEASDYQEVSRIIREEVKGSDPRKNALILTIDKVGTIFAMQEGQQYFVGSLEVSAEETPIQQAIHRIIDNAGIMQK
jgi:hypothetical protein